MNDGETPHSLRAVCAVALVLSGSLQNIGQIMRDVGGLVSIVLNILVGYMILLNQSSLQVNYPLVLKEQRVFRKSIRRVLDMRVNGPFDQETKRIFFLIKHKCLTCMLEFSFVLVSVWSRRVRLYMKWGFLGQNRSFTSLNKGAKA